RPFSQSEEAHGDRDAPEPSASRALAHRAPRVASLSRQQGKRKSREHDGLRRIAERSDRREKRREHAVDRRVVAEGEEERPAGEPREEEATPPRARREGGQDESERGQAQVR